MQATDKLGPVSFPSSYGEYAAVRIAVFLNYAPDDELDMKVNPTLHFQRDVSGKFYNITIRNLFDSICSNADPSVFCHCDEYVHVDGSHKRLVGY
jgi:hypothetical protein